VKEFTLACFSVFQMQLVSIHKVQTNFAVSQQILSTAYRIPDVVS
jgi:hypothetical protein